MQNTQHKYQVVNVYELIYNFLMFWETFFALMVLTWFNEGLLFGLILFVFFCLGLYWWMRDAFTSKTKYLPKRGRETWVCLCVRGSVWVNVCQCVCVCVWVSVPVYDCVCECQCMRVKCQMFRTQLITLQKLWLKMQMRGSPNMQVCDSRRLHIQKKRNTTFLNLSWTSVNSQS